MTETILFQINSIWIQSIVSPLNLFIFFGGGGSNQVTLAYEIIEKKTT